MPNIRHGCLTCAYVGSVWVGPWGKGHVLSVTALEESITMKIIYFSEKIIIIIINRVGSWCYTSCIFFFE